MGGGAGREGICLLRSLMNWEIIIQCSATTKDKQIDSGKYFKEHGLSQSPRRQGGSERQQARGKGY